MPVAQFFTNFSKKRNSTKRPTIDPQFNVNVEFKQPTDIYHPTLIIRGVDSYEHVTYMYMDGWYYYVNRIVSNRDFWEVTADIDELATWKDDIGNYTGYVSRAGNTVNPDIRDPLTTTLTITTNTLKGASGTYPVGEFGHGCFILGVNGGATCTFYSMSPAMFRSLRQWMFSIPEWVDNTTGTAISLLSDYEKTQFNPLQYVASCIWIPSDSFIIGSAVPIEFGGFKNSHITGHPVTSADTADFTGVISCDRHPQYDETHRYLQYEPFSQYVFEYSPIGRILIPAGLCNGSFAPSVSYSINIDPLTGNGKYALAVGSSYFARGTAPFGVDVPLGQTTATAKSTISSMFEIANQWANKTLPGVGFGGWADAFHEETMATRNYQYLNGTPSLANLAEVPHVVESFTSVILPNHSVVGYPANSTAKVSTLTGYMQMYKGDINTSAPEPYKSNIRNYLVNGFYYE